MVKKHWIDEFNGPFKYQPIHNELWIRNSLDRAVVEFAVYLEFVPENERTIKEFHEYRDVEVDMVNFLVESLNKLWDARQQELLQNEEHDR